MELSLHFLIVVERQAYLEDGTSLTLNILWVTLRYSIRCGDGG